MPKPTTPAVPAVAVNILVPQDVHDAARHRAIDERLTLKAYIIQAVREKNERR